MSYKSDLAPEDCSPTQRAVITGATVAGFDGILAVVKGAEMQRARLRVALERIATIVNSALS